MYSNNQITKQSTIEQVNSSVVKKINNKETKTIYYYSIKVDKRRAIVKEIAKER